jgi:hypothetical protein
MITIGASKALPSSYLSLAGLNEASSLLHYRRYNKELFTW